MVFGVGCARALKKPQDLAPVQHRAHHRRRSVARHDRMERRPFDWGRADRRGAKPPGTAALDRASVYGRRSNDRNVTSAARLLVGNRRNDGIGGRV